MTEQLEERWRRQIEAYHEAALLHAAVKLGLPELMGDEAWTAEALALALSVPPSPFRRLLRGLVAIGVCAEQADGSFALTPSGQALKRGATSRLAEKALVVVEQYWRPWAELLHSVEGDRPSFERVFGASIGEWRRDHPEQGALFESYLGQETLANAAPIIEALDLGGAHSVADIGGGYGGLLAALLQAHPAISGVLIDQPHVMAGARAFLQSLSLTERVDFVTADILENVPAKAGLYLLNGVLRQFHDKACTAILRNCRAAMPDGAKLIVIERLLPERASDDPAAIMLDLHMLAITGGRLRTRAEIEALLSQADFTKAACRQILNGPVLMTVIPGQAGQ
jgi:hypothetical protein